MLLPMQLLDLDMTQNQLVGTLPAPWNRLNSVSCWHNNTNGSDVIVEMQSLEHDQLCVV